MPDWFKSDLNETIYAQYRLSTQPASVGFSLSPPYFVIMYSSRHCHHLPVKRGGMRLTNYSTALGKSDIAICNYRCFPERMNLFKLLGSGLL